MDERTKQDILSITGFSPGSLPFRYLGIPLAARKLRSSDYCKLVDAIAAKINSWPRHSLSYAGKIELIRSVVQGIECYWLSILPIPNCVISSIYSLCRKFVWHSKHPPIAWENLCKSLEDGGLGLKNLMAWNKALIAKTLWKIQLRKESLWIKWVNHIYSHFGDVWHWGWHKDESPLIKQIISLRDELLHRSGSVAAASTLLNSWFARNHGFCSAYDFFNNWTGKWPWKPLISRSFILPKHRFTFWLLAHAKLLTRDRLPFVVEKSCVLCKSEPESDIRAWLGMSKRMESPTAILRAFRTTYGGKLVLARMRLSALAAIIYTVWNARNMTMFDEEDHRIEDLVRKIKIIVFHCIPSSTDMFNTME
ncbi:uncharacterized protein LOC142530721 [Primulina tabacum]|uniref:uncharacterized protein LOC142530721 n=1 Tax=Primulina tabacum TaxID=48773 RepID=UPI003F59DD4F